MADRIEEIRKHHQESYLCHTDCDIVVLLTKLDEVTANLADAEDTIAWQKHYIQKFENEVISLKAKLDQIHKVCKDREYRGWDSAIFTILDAPTQQKEKQ